MTRLIRARLPNGELVQLVQPVGRNCHAPCGATSTAAELAALVTEDATDIQLSEFLATVATTVFPEADPTARPTIEARGERSILDLVFPLKTGGTGGVQVKMPAFTDVELRTDFALRVEHLVDGIVDFVGPRRLYIIAGRDEDWTKLELASLNDDLARLRVSAELLTWDNVIGRLEQDAKHTAGQVVLVEIIDLSRRLLALIASNHAILNALDDRKFEELVATLLSDLGLEDVLITPPRKDAGYDILATFTDRDRNKSSLLIECKHWVAGDRVSLKWAVRLQSVAARQQASSSILLATGGFGPRLLEQEAVLSRSHLFLKGRPDLLSWIELWQRRYGQALLEPIHPADVLGLPL